MHTVRTDARNSELTTTPIDRNEFERIAKNSRPAVYRMALRLSGNPCQAEDLTQETFLRAYRAFHTYDKGRPVLPWLARITHNLHIDQLRAKKAPQETSLDMLQENASGDRCAVLDIPDSSHAPERILLDQIIDERLDRAVRALPVAYRTVVILADVKGLSYEEIGTILKCGLGTVRSRLHRGRAMLRQAVLSSDKNDTALLKIAA